MIANREREISEELLLTGENLKEQFEEKKEEEIVVERKSVKSITSMINVIRMALCAFLALIGAVSIINPSLRQAFVSLIRTFIMEIGLP